MFNNRNRIKELTFPILLKRCFLFTIFFSVVTVLLVLILSAFFYNTENPTSKLQLIATISMYLATFFSAFFLSKLNGGLYFWGGLILGTIILALILVISIFVKVENQNIFLQLALPVISILGAMLGQKREKRNNRRKKFNR